MPHSLIKSINRSCNLNLYWWLTLKQLVKIFLNKGLQTNDKESEDDLIFHNNYYLDLNSKGCLLNNNL